MTTGVVVTHAYRTAVGKSGKALSQTRPDELLGLLIQGFLERTPELDPASIDDVIIGCAFPEAEQGLGPGGPYEGSESEAVAPPAKKPAHPSAKNPFEGK